MALVLMSKRELNRVEVLARLSEGRLDASSAAQLMRVGERQVYRLLKAFKNGGAASLAHRHRGRRSNNRISLAIKEEALALIRKNYADFGPTLAGEQLAERHGIKGQRPHRLFFWPSERCHDNSLQNAHFVKSCDFQRA